MDAFKGKYERTSADKYEEMLKELDVNFLLRKAATVSTPGVFPSKYGSAHRTFIAVCDITEEGGEWTIKTSTTLKTMELKFKVTIGSLTFWQLWTLFGAEYFLNI